MDENKRKFALWIHPSTLEKVDRLYALDNCKSKSEYIEKAVLFYSGYVTAQDGKDDLGSNGFMKLKKIIFPMLLSVPCKARWIVLKTEWLRCFSKMQLSLR